MMRYLGRACLAILGTLLAILLALGLLTRIALARVNVPDLEHRLSQATNLEAHVAGLGVDWKGLLLLKNVSLSWHGHAVLTTPEAGLRVAVWQVWNTQPDVLYLRLSQPVLSWDDALQDWWQQSPPTDPSLHLRVSIQDGLIEHGALRLTTSGFLTLSLPHLTFDLTARDNRRGQYRIKGDSSTWSGHVTTVSMETIDARLPDLDVSGDFTVTGQSSSADWTVLGHALHTEALWTSDTLHCRLASDPLLLTLDARPDQVSGTFSNGGPPIAFEAHGQWGQAIDVTLGQARAHLDGVLPHLKLTVDGPLPVGFPLEVHAQALQDGLASAHLTSSAMVAGMPFSALGDAAVHVDGSWQFDVSGQGPSGDHGSVHFQYKAGTLSTHIEMASLHVKGSIFSGTADFTRDNESNTSLTGHLKSTGDLGGNLNLEGYWGKTDSTGLRFDAPAPTWRGQLFLPFQGIVTFSNGLFHLELHIPNLFPGLDLALDYDPVKNHIQARTELKGQTADLLFPMVSPNLPNLRGNMFGELEASGSPIRPSFVFNGRLVHGDLGRLELGDGTMTLKYQPPAVAISVDANLDLQDLASVHILLPELEGKGRLHILWHGRLAPVEGTLQSDDTRLDGRPLGPLSVHFTKRGDDLHLDSVTLPYTQPPAVLSGDWNASTRHFHLHGKIRKATATVPFLTMPGPLTGPVDIDGTPDKGTLRVGNSQMTW
ncbi:MAG TPA: hypothetical protein VGO93_14655 [Candidatus Xenobia bacterium]|jgi:hypothetical protein